MNKVVLHSLLLNAADRLAALALMMERDPMSAILARSIRAEENAVRHAILELNTGPEHSEPPPPDEEIRWIRNFRVEGGKAKSQTKRTLCAICKDPVDIPPGRPAPAPPITCYKKECMDEAVKMRRRAQGFA